MDFVARGPAGELELIQVCADASEPQTLGREVRALEEAKAMFPRATRRLLTLTQDAMPTEVPAGIVVEPVYEWLLAQRGKR